MIYRLQCDVAEKFKTFSNNGLTLRSADAAAPRANVGGISGKGHAPAVGEGRRRRAADANVGQTIEKAEAR